MPYTPTAADLRAEAERFQQFADEMTAKADAAARAELEASRPKMPSVADGPAFVMFTKYMSGREYAYAAVGWRIGRSVRWAITGAESNERRNWPGLLMFIGEANWSTIRVLTPGGQLLPPEAEPPAVEEMGQFGRVFETGGY
jgi:hypothetical protein